MGAELGEVGVGIDFYSAGIGLDVLVLSLCG
jgi:hypothetical protein